MRVLLDGRRKLFLILGCLFSQTQNLIKFRNFQRKMRHQSARGDVQRRFHMDIREEFLCGGGPGRHLACHIMIVIVRSSAALPDVGG